MYMYIYIYIYVRIYTSEHAYTNTYMCTYIYEQQSVRQIRFNKYKRAQESKRKLLAAQTSSADQASSHDHMDPLGGAPWWTFHISYLIDRMNSALWYSVMDIQYLTSQIPRSWPHECHFVIISDDYLQSHVHRPFPRRWDWKCSSKCKSKSSMVKVHVSFQMSPLKRDLWWPSRISICIPMTISSLIFSETGCNRPHGFPLVILRDGYSICHMSYLISKAHDHMSATLWCFVMHISCLTSNISYQISHIQYLMFRFRTSSLSEIVTYIYIYIHIHIYIYVWWIFNISYLISHV